MSFYNTYLILILEAVPCKQPIKKYKNSYGEGEMKKGFISLIFIMILSISGCASLMPSETNIAISPWSEYAEVKKQFEKIEPYKTKISDLKDLSFDPEKNPNTTYLNYLNVRNLFINNPSVKTEDLPGGIQDCFINFEYCYAFEFKLENIKTEGQGNIVLRLLKFREENLTTGPRVSFKVFLVGNLVVYKLPPEGTPHIRKYTLKKRPLGLLQDIGSDLKENMFSP
ncbi:MAG: hypothetical protein US61_C0010G0010 [Parcubacteria group bacterium GW2011_GWE2_37_8]|nr:MAG: hypothetical protein US61_C0010G0010 [Parcubacteria group bacterium GW2011_GWE2_37_8]